MDCADEAATSAYAERVRAYATANNILIQGCDDVGCAACGCTAHIITSNEPPQVGRCPREG